ncbi:MAG: hypothetical protein ABIZ09_13420, partial [Rhodoferax sp.]
MKTPQHSIHLLAQPRALLIAMGLLLSVSAFAAEPAAATVSAPAKAASSQEVQETVTKPVPLESLP